jgi:hypothetical protein
MLVMWSGVISTPEGSDDEALRKLFMRIDAKCDATVDWCVDCSLVQCYLACVLEWMYHTRQQHCLRVQISSSALRASQCMQLRTNKPLCSLSTKFKLMRGSQ